MNRLRIGVALYNAGRYLAAHEPLEELWLDAPTGERDDCLQGLIQASAAVYKARRGNDAGAVGLAESASEYINDCSTVDAEALRPWLSEVAVRSRRRPRHRTAATPPRRARDRDLRPLAPGGRRGRRGRRRGRGRRAYKKRHQVRRARSRRRGGDESVRDAHAGLYKRPDADRPTAPDGARRTAKKCGSRTLRDYLNRFADQYRTSVNRRHCGRHRRHACEPGEHRGSPRSGRHDNRGETDRSVSFRAVPLRVARYIRADLATDR